MLAGIQDVDMTSFTPVVSTTRRSLPIGLKEIPDRPFDSSISQFSSLDDAGGSQGEGERSSYTPKRVGDQSSRMQELEAKVFLLEGLLTRVARLEALEVTKRPGHSRSRDIELPSSADVPPSGRRRSRDIELPSSAEAPPASKPPSRGALGVRFEDSQDVNAVRIKIA